MLIILSPAKTLDLNTSGFNELASLPYHTTEATELMDNLRTYITSDLAKEMNVSKKLAEKVSTWHTNWTTHTTVKEAISSEAKPCAFAMKGEAFKFLDAPSLTPEDLRYAQQNLMILSGLYGILKPCDLIMPYRLEMGQAFQVNPQHKSLNSFWSPVYYKAFSKRLEGHENGIILNLASDEYSKVVLKSGIHAEVITCSFKEEGKKGLKSISTFAKQARGEMTRFVIKKQIKSVEKLKSFNNLRYTFNSDLSDSNNFVFTRPLNK